MFAHLHNHSDHTPLNSVLAVDQLAARAAALGHTYVALTDTGVLHGAVDFDRACKRHGVKPIFGAACWVSFPDAKEPDGFECQLVLLVQDAAGWSNLCRLLTLGLAQIRYHPRVTLDQLAEHQVGLQVLTGGPHGLLARAKSPEEALGRYDALVEVVNPDRVTVELVDHGTSTCAQLLAHAGFLRERREVTAVVTNACRHLEPEGSAALRLVRAVALGRQVGDPPADPLDVTDQAYVKSEDELLLAFPGEAEALAYSQVIADRCRYALPQGRVLLPVTEPPVEIASRTARWRWMVEAFPWPAWIGSKPPKKAPDAERLSPEMLRAFATAGLHVRLVDDEGKVNRDRIYFDRLDRELRVIVDLGFDSYLLIVSEIVSWARSQDIPVGPGRGSVAGSLVAWCLGITDLDPIRWGLLFERFLNVARGKKGAPDIDLDFAQAGRGRVIDHMRERYGADRVAQILTIGTFAGLSAVKDAARVHRIGFQEANAWTTRVEQAMTHMEQPSLSALQRHPAIRSLQEVAPSFRATLQYAEVIEGLARQTGIHAGGVVIADRPLAELLPVHTESGTVAVGADMDGVEALGLVKFDILGVKSLDVIQRACQLVHETHGVDLDPGTFPDHDEDTLRLLREGDLHGLFQLKSAGMRRLCRDLLPTAIDDVCALVALYRPGPLASGMTESYVERRHGREEATPIHPLLEPILKDTYQVLLYQEDVMQAAVVLAGYDLAEADLLRRAMGKKKPEEMASQQARFLEGCANRGVSEADALGIFEGISKFATYGFNKSHAAAYGLITWRTAYLKAHWPAEYMAAVMTWDAGDKEQLNRAVMAARNMGLRILPPDVQHSRAGFSMEGGAIRFGFGAIKGIGVEPARKLEQMAPYVERPENLRGHVGRRVAKALAAAGALDGLCDDRLEAVERMAPRKGKAQAQAQAVAQGALFPTLVHGERGHKEHEVRGQSWNERNRAEIEVLGVVLSGNPLDRYGALEARSRTATVEDVLKRRGNAHVRLVCVIESARKDEQPHRPVAWFLRISDRTGAMSMSLLEGSALFNVRDLTPGSCVQIHGERDPKVYGGLRTTAVFGLDTMRQRNAEARLLPEQGGQINTTATLYLDHTLPQRGVVEIAEIFARHPGPIPLSIRWRFPWGIAVLRCPQRVSASVSLFEALERVTGNPEALLIR